MSEIDSIILNGTEYSLDDSGLESIDLRNTEYIIPNDIDNIVLNNVEYMIAGTVTPAFIADFSGSSPSPLQFYSWEGRDYGSTITDDMDNVVCSDGVVTLSTVYDSTREKWIRQMICTGGLFESDNFTLTFDAKFSGTAGSWQNVITYGTGTHWTNGTYSDGIRWPAGGEIDAFEQAGGYSANPNTFSPVFHYGSGSGSGYPDTNKDQSIRAGISLPINEWASYKFKLSNGIVKLYVNNVFVAQGDGSNIVVNNGYLWNYHPFLKPQAFYIDGQCSTSSSTSNEYHFYVKNFQVITESKQITPCTGLSIFPQMWGSGKTIVFPTGVHLYLDREYTPTNTSNKACVWESSNTAVATVCQGYVTTVGEGQCTMRATCGSVTASYNLTVSNSSTSVPCAGVKATTEGFQIVKNNTKDIAGSIYKYPSFTTDSLQVTSSNTSVASVSGTVITGVGFGTATITVKCGNATTTIPVTVSSGIILDTDLPSYSSSTKAVMSDFPDYDYTQIYSFQYTFASHTSSRGSTTPNVYIGPSKSNNAERNGAITFYGTSGWKIIRGGSSVAFEPSAGDVLTIVVNMATGKMDAYLNNTQIITNASSTNSYYTDSVKIISKEDNDNMTVAPTHIKIAIGDLH